MRLFIALEIAPIAPPSGSPNSGSAPEHLTLRFLGETSSNHVPEIEAAIDRVARTSAPFDLVLEGLGAFPSRANPRVVWVGVGQGHREVVALAERIAAELEPQPPGVPHEEFVPHLTLFRVRTLRQRQRAAALLAGTESPPTARVVPVRQIFLKQSTLTPQGAQHRTLAAWPLAGGTAAPP